MVDLALAHDAACGEGRAVLSTASLAQRQDISEAYLEQLLRLLKKAGLVKSVRGAGGGYLLSREAERIGVGEILRALEEATDIIHCVNSSQVDCENACSCSTRPLWLKLQSRINHVLNETTLADMAEDYMIQIRRKKEHESIS